MPELLSAIEFVPTKSNGPLPTPTLDSSYTLPTSPRAIIDTHLVSDSAARAIFDLEDGRLRTERIVVIIAVLTGVQFLGSLSNGFIVIGLPRIAADLALPAHLMLWPSAVY